MADNAFIKGLTTGLILQLAIGPVFIFILHIAVQSGFGNGILAVIAVTIVDYIYITLALLGVGRILEIKSIYNVLIVISSLVLFFFGLIIVIQGIHSAFLHRFKVTAITSGIKSFTAAFILTMSNPLTIVFWTGIFTAKSMEYSYTKNELIIFGLSAGLSTLLFLSTSVSIVSYFNTMIPLMIFRLLNIIVGVILITYGISRIISLLTYEV